MSSAQGVRNSSFSHFFPTAAKRKAAKERQKSIPEGTPGKSQSPIPSVADEQQHPQTAPQNGTRRQLNSDTSAPPDHIEKLSPPQDPGDLLNGVGSASSLASTSSSIFSTTVDTKPGQTCTEITFNSTTPLTNHESSPPQPSLSPRYKSRPEPSSRQNLHYESGKSAQMLASSIAADAFAKRVAKVMPGYGEPKGSKIVYDPDLDSTLAMKDKRKAKPRYEPLAEEV